MAHANLHMAVGLAFGTAATVVPVVRAWMHGAPLSGPLGRLLFAGYALGVWALMPNLMTSVGMPALVHHAWWSNIFVLHPVIDRYEDGGLLIGQLLLVVVLACQYALIVLAIRRARRRPS